MAKKYISLKEAAQISGYSSDYVGQLIREGKIPGKKVYTNITWMTTEDSLRRHMLRQIEVEKLPQESRSLSVKDRLEYAFRRFLVKDGIVKVASIALYVGVSLVCLIALMSFYMVSVAIDDRFEEQALQSMVIDDTPYGYSNP